MTIRTGPKHSQNNIANNMIVSKFEAKIPMQQLQEPKGDSENSEFSSERISSGSENLYEDSNFNIVNHSFS